MPNRPSVELSSSVLDSHPRRTNGFMTGCLLSLLEEETKKTSSSSGLILSDLAGLVDDEMHAEGAKAEVFAGVECRAEAALTDVWGEHTLLQKK